MVDWKNMIAGIVLLFAGLWTLLPLQDFLGAVPFIGIYAGAGWSEFVNVLIGTVPVFFVFLGIVLIWIGKE